MPDQTLPKYHQLYREIADSIRQGQLQPGDRLPPERTLSELHGVSRATVRRAMRDLVEDGLVEAGVGRGSFVAEGPLTEPANVLMSFTELGAQRGLTASATVLDLKVKPATLEESEVFAIAPGADLILLRRVRKLDDVPIAVDLERIPKQILPELLDADLTTASTFAMFGEAGHAAVRAEITVEASPAKPDEMEFLGLGEGEPVLVAYATIVNKSGRVIEASRTAYRYDRYQFNATLLRPVTVREEHTT